MWLQQAGRDSAQGNMLNEMRGTGMLYIKVWSNPLLSKHVVSHFDVFLMFLLLSLPFFPHCELFIFKRFLFKGPCK